MRLCEEHQTQKATSNLEDPQTQHILRDPDSTLNMSSSIVVSIKGSEYSFIFFWPSVETDKGHQGQREWTNTSSFSKGFSNDYPTKSSISGNDPTPLIWCFSTTLNALTLFSNVSQIPAYERSWRPEEDQQDSVILLCHYSAKIK